jgi:hypothetical protein
MKKITCEIWVDPKRYKFANDEQYWAFMKALGRQVAYAIGYANDSDVNVRGGIDLGANTSDTEICFTYTPCENGEVNFTPSGRGFTMAAVARDNGESYSYHS